MKKSVIMIDLKHSIEVDGETVNKLKLRRPKLKHFKHLALDNITGEAIIGLIGKLADLPPSQVGEIDIEDLEAVGKAIEDFIPNSLRPGAGTSPK